MEPIFEAQFLPEECKTEDGREAAMRAASQFECEEAVIWIDSAISQTASGLGENG